MVSAGLFVSAAGWVSVGLTGLVRAQLLNYSITFHASVTFSGTENPSGLSSPSRNSSKVYQGMIGLRLWLSPG